MHGSKESLGQRCPHGELCHVQLQRIRLENLEAVMPHNCPTEQHTAGSDRRSLLRSMYGRPSVTLDSDLNSLCGRLRVRHVHPGRIPVVDVQMSETGDRMARCPSW